MIRRTRPQEEKRKVAKRRRRKPPPKPKPVKAIKLLVKMRKKVNLTAFQFSSLSYSDYKYWQKLETGEAENPSRNYLMGMAKSLVGYTKLFDDRDVDKVLAAAGFPPAPAPKFGLVCPHCQREIL